MKKCAIGHGKPLIGHEKNVNPVNSKIDHENHEKREKHEKHENHENMQNHEKTNMFCWNFMDHSPGVCVCFRRCPIFPGNSMAKTKKCIAEIRTDLHAPPPNGGDPPPKRLKGKTGGENKVKNEQVDVPPRCPFEITWENIEKVMSFYKLSEQDATKLLLEVAGPDTRQSHPGVWATYAHRIKQERLEAAQQEALYQSQAAARAANLMLQPILPDNQEGDETLFPPVVPPTDYDEGEEEEGEENEDDPEVDVGVPANGGKGDGDDQDSPSSGVPVPVDPKVQVCTPQPEEPLEPVRTPVEIQQAAKDAGDELSQRIAQVATPMTQSTIAEAGVSSPPPLRSMLSFDFISTNFGYTILFPFHISLPFSSHYFMKKSIPPPRSCNTLVLGQEHLSKQASTGDVTKAKESDVDSESFRFMLVCFVFTQTTYTKMMWTI